MRAKYKTNDIDPSNKFYGFYMASAVDIVSRCDRGARHQLESNTNHLRIPSGIWNLDEESEMLSKMKS